MAVTVRVQNFQSIEDATIVIDGLTVITGTNNSGKTAVMRAVRGVFTNAPPGPLVRHGCAHLSVTLTFDDGTTILWEKGWEKPGRKGKTINRYTINGKQIATVGRGVPPEVEALGVREINAASDRVWPQIADQFDGTLFLVNRPGSAVAEALSDVERVGKLTAALKASEKDRRAVNAELKVRRKDVQANKQQVEKYDGLDSVGDEVRRLGDSKDTLDALVVEIADLTSLRDRYSQALGSVDGFAGFDPSVIPDTTRVDKLRQGVSVVTGLRDRRATLVEDVRSLQSFKGVDFPDTELLSEQQERIAEVTSLRDRYASARAASQAFAGLSAVDLPSTDRIDTIRSNIATVSALQARRIAARSSIAEALSDAEANSASLADANREVKQLLGDRGVCPTCNTIHEGGHA